jgi:hypothetical protein
MAEKMDTEDIKEQNDEARKSCENFDVLLATIDLILQDPYYFTYEHVTFLKNEVQLKGEEAIFKINESMTRAIIRLDGYNSECKNSFKEAEYLRRSEVMRLEKETGRRDLEKWLATLDEIKEKNDEELKRIKSESEMVIELLENKLVEFKFDLFPKSLSKFKDEIETDFGELKIDPNFDFG